MFPSEKTSSTVLAIDPGSAKCGVAVVARGGDIRFRAVIATQEMLQTVEHLAATYHPDALVMGRGTGSKALREQLQQTFPALPLHLVEEAHTSEAARARFLAETAPTGWQRLLPRSLRTPWLPYDDLVAVILAERFWQQTAPPKYDGAED